MTPVLVLTGGTTDRAAHYRSDTAWIAARLADGESGVLPVWRDLSLVDEDGGASPSVLRGAAATQLLAAAEDSAFLGLDDRGRALFAASLPLATGEALCRAWAPAAAFKDLAKLAPVLDAAGGALLAYARALLRWHRHHRFCGCCGAPTESSNGGHLRLCTNAACGERQFPRTDPVVIMLVTRVDACLLARQPAWIAGLYSTLAGFVEPGESLEEAVIREVREETGLSAVAVTYIASQPWPFPQSLMLGFRVEVRGGERLAFDTAEIEDARWFTRDDFAALRQSGIRLPYRGTIARSMIDAWLAESAALSSRRPEPAIGR
ncbi:MAG: NAD(+) diphosphatase [Rhodospirillales bacterium]|jgi:NAD+ diphosphatase|nr:NAD(+) diphosphatase [Rhodospirillales bacterium]